jgi:hypothetical protein
MAEFLFKRRDYTHPDPEKDRRGVHKKTDFINCKPDGFSDFAHGNGPGSYLNDFIIIKVPGITLDEAEASDHRKSWKDDFGYQIVATRPAKGEYDIRVFEQNAGAINQNAIAGVKATKIRDYLQSWGCSSFNLSETDATFTFSLWDAVRSANFWDVPLLGLAGIVFTLNSYNSQTGIAEIDVNYAETQIKPEMVIRKVEEQGGTVLSAGSLNCVFTIERLNILTRFRADVKRRMEQTYMRHQYGISQADHDAIVAAGGIVTWTKAEFLSKLIDKMAG